MSIAATHRAPAPAAAAVETYAYLQQYKHHWGGTDDRLRNQQVNGD
jgi:hypothetical protein